MPRRLQPICVFNFSTFAVKKNTPQKQNPKQNTDIMPTT